jgi:hypothetical protein
MPTFARSAPAWRAGPTLDRGWRAPSSEGRRFMSFARYAGWVAALCVWSPVSRLGPDSFAR